MNPLTAYTNRKPDCIIIDGRYIVNAEMSVGGYGEDPQVNLSIAGEGATSVMEQMHGSPPLPAPEPDSSLTTIKRLTESNDTLRVERDLSQEEAKAYREMVSDYEGEITALTDKIAALNKKIARSNALYTFDPANDAFAAGGVISNNTLPQYAARDAAMQTTAYDAMKASMTVKKDITKWLQ